MHCVKKEGGSTSARVSLMRRLPWSPNRTISLMIAPMTAISSMRTIQQEGVNTIAPPRSDCKLETPGRSAFTVLPAPLACRTVLCPALVEAALIHSPGVLRHQLSGICATRIDHQVAQAILRIGSCHASPDRRLALITSQLFTPQIE